jgi:hypothetical protein
VILKTSQTSRILEYQTWAPGTYTIPIQPNGNSLLSSVLVTDVGAAGTVKVNYFQTTAANEQIERTNLTGHPLISTASTSARQTLVTKIHSKIFAEIIISGNDVVVGLLVTIVSSFASDLDAALKLDQQDVDLGVDRGMPLAVYDVTNEKWVFLRTDASGALITAATFSPPVANKTVSGFAAIGPAGSADVLSYTIPSGKTFQLLSATASATGDFKHELIVNLSTLRTRRNSFMERDTELTLPLELQAGDIVKIKSTSGTVFGTTNSVDAHISGKEF